MHPMNDANKKEIIKIVITGGPCGGKSTALSKIQEFFAKEYKKYTTLFVPETATELIKGCVTKDTCGSNLNFQKQLMKLQLEKEKIFEEAALLTKTDKVLIICDRGALDGKAYVEESEFKQILEAVGSSEVELRDNYDAVFHLVTAANGALDYYTTANNSARRETPEEAIEKDEKLVSAWTGHPHLRIVDNSVSFKKKIKKLISEIVSFLGEPKPYEIERKYLIKYPDIDWLENNPNCQRVEIIQTYLNSVAGEEARVRQRGDDGTYIYTHTIKKKVSGAKRIEIERRLSQEEYLRLLMDADTKKRPIRKTRYCLIYENQYFEIDIYPFWKKRAIAEIELRSARTKIKFPEEIKMIREVTNDEAYKNASLAKRR